MHNLKYYMVCLIWVRQRTNKEQNKEFIEENKEISILKVRRDPENKTRERKIGKESEEV